jgi:hypothetical protein
MKYRVQENTKKYRLGQDFPHLSKQALGITQPLIHGCPVIPGINLPGHDVSYPLPPSAEVKERTELFLHSPSGPSWPVLGRTLPLRKE